VNRRKNRKRKKNMWHEVHWERKKTIDGNTRVDEQDTLVLVAKNEGTHDDMTPGR
jgi:hypothetical protein